MRDAPITLTTDYGSRDHFVGAMKGVILSIAPRARVVDITHEIAPFDVLEGAFVIGQAWRTFPRGTVHVVVVDPGVGSDRKPLLIQTADQFFIGPDNGVFSFLLREERHKVRDITASKFFHHPVSQTFHGRDIFAPVAAHLAMGVAPAKFGKLQDVCLLLDGIAPLLGETGVWRGAVLKTDRFGNLITNFDVLEFRKLPKQRFEMTAGDRRIKTLRANFSEGTPGEPIVIAGSSGFFEIAVNQGSAAQLLGCAAGSPVTLKLL